MKTMRSFLIPLIGALTLASVAHAGPTRIKSEPLSSVVSVSSGAVQTNKCTTVPMITWGADVRTVYAAGNQVKSAKGSLFDQAGLSICLKRVDDFKQQVESFIAGDTPYLRGTVGMINMATDAVHKAGLDMKIIYQLSWSVGGDALVAKSNIKTLADLKGKTVAIQAYGPHVSFLIKMLATANLTPNDVNIVWLSDLTGTDNTPMSALYEKDVDAAFVIIPDALALTNGGNVGDGTEDSIKGAHILIDTKAASRVIADVYAVRTDYLDANKGKVEAFVNAMMKSEEQVRGLRKSKNATYQRTMKAAAQILLDSDSKSAIADTEGMFADALHTGYSANMSFLTDKTEMRNANRLSTEVQKGLTAIGMIASPSTLAVANLDWRSVASGLKNAKVKSAPKMSAAAVQTAIAKKQAAGTLAQDGAFSFEVYFKPEQTNFVPEMYVDAFNKVLDAAATFGGAAISVEGHADPLGYLKQRKGMKGRINETVLRTIRQGARDLSAKRAIQVRDSIIGFAKDKSISFDQSQFVIVPLGITDPQTGFCGSVPCAPQTKAEWHSNMRVVFRIVPVQVEATSFELL